MKRLSTAAVAIPIALLLTHYSPDWLFALFGGLVSAFMLEEYLELSVSSGRARPGRWFLIPGALVTASFYYHPFGPLHALALCTLCLMTSYVFAADRNDVFGGVTTGLGGVMYCCLLLGFMLLVPRQAIYMLFAIIWAGDTAAYYGGRAFGRHLLAPRVSPKKTVEGAFSGLLGSIIAGSAVGVWVLKQPWMAMAGISAITAIAGQIGDLAESALKRSAGVKDSSSILPGHGGILDRLDSLLFAAPVFFWLFNP